MISCSNSQYLRQISGCRNDRYRITKTQAAHRYVYQGQIIPDLVFPDTFMMPHSGFEDYSQNMRAYYFWAIDSGFRVRKPSVTALTFWRRYCYSGRRKFQRLCWIQSHHRIKYLMKNIIQICDIRDRPVAIANECAPPLPILSGIANS